jgi:peptidoglycan hydrolase-like protein with peptidoglycan-binding domain
VTMPTPAATGRGAWTTRGNLVASKYYKRGCSTTKASGTQDEWAVKQGSAAIQTLLGGLTVDGSFGPMTEARIKAYQSANGLTADGVVGPKTMQKLVGPLVTNAEVLHKVPKNLAYGIIWHESGFDPGAVGSSTPLDLGLSQINTRWGTDPYDAMNPAFNIEFVAKKAGLAYARYLAIQTNKVIVYNATILQHNAPSYANYYAKYGTYQTEAIRIHSENYIAKVKQKIALLSA